MVEHGEFTSENLVSIAHFVCYFCCWGRIHSSIWQAILWNTDYWHAVVHVWMGVIAVFPCARNAKENLGPIRAGPIYSCHDGNNQPREGSKQRGQRNIQIHSFICGSIQSLLAGKYIVVIHLSALILPNMSGQFRLDFKAHAGVELVSDLI